MKNGVAENWEDPELVESVAKDLEAFNKETDDDDGGTPKPEEPTPQVTDDEPAAADEPTPNPDASGTKEDAQASPDTAGEKDATPAKGGGEPAGEKKESEERPAIPDAHFRAAVHVLKMPADQAAAKISALYDKDPEVALQWLATCYEQVNAASRQLGELGQAMRKAREASTVPPQAAPDAVAAPAADAKLAAKIAKLRSKYEDDPVIDVLEELLMERQSTAAPAPTAPTAKPAVASADRSVDEEIAIRQQISTFFADPDLEAYEDFYGPAKGPDGSAVGTWDHLTPGQKANRLEMLQRAQLILDGAEAAGMKLSTAEAMERAHLEVSAPIVSQIVREKIKASVVKRAKGVTLKPSAGKTPPASGGKYNEQEHIKEVGEMLKEIFGS
jgi:hypothetical protein